MANGDNSLDILGVKPIAQAVDKTTEASIAGISAFLSRICLPAAEEFGLFLQDKVKAWRAQNARNILEKTQSIHARVLERNGDQVHPRIVAAVLENGSWVNDDEVQSMWAGLLASSCSVDGQDQSNLVFINILRQMTDAEVRLINYACKNARVVQLPAGYIACIENFIVNKQQVAELLGTDDLHKMDLLQDHCRELGLLTVNSGFDPNSSGVAVLTPTAIALQLCARGHGFLGSPAEFYGVTP